MGVAVLSDRGHAGAVRGRPDLALLKRIGPRSCGSLYSQLWRSTAVHSTTKMGRLIILMARALELVVAMKGIALADDRCADYRGATDRLFLNPIPAEAALALTSWFAPALTFHRLIGAAIAVTLHAAACCLP